jgi:hypothetical protein
MEKKNLRITIKTLAKEINKLNEEIEKLQALNNYYRHLIEKLNPEPVEPK